MKNSLEKAGYILNVNNDIWMHPDYKSIDYSDGDDNENYVANIIKNSEDVSVLSQELRQHCIDWPSTYHLHPNRANLLRPLADYLKGDVLEIGCGCGAITRFLGENGANLLALEGSIRRASIARSRTRDLDNVTVLSEKFSDLKIDKKFDAVTFIGVLEYSRKFSNNELIDGINSTLKLAKSFLKPNGKLIIAIENKLGLKYFAGFAEDHFGKPMFGIEDHYDINSIVTFGRKELGKRVAAVGLSVHEWWYPFPDYKLPTLLVSEDGAKPIEGFNLGTLTKSASSTDMQYPKYVNFMQERALTSIINNDLLPEVANSFLLVASFELAITKDIKPLAIYFSADRKPQFTKKVVFKKSENQSIVLRICSLADNNKLENNYPLIQTLNDDIYYSGDLLQDRLFDLLSSPNWQYQQIQAWFDTWFDAFCVHVNIDNKSKLTNTKVAGKFFDAIPRNLVITKQGQAVFIDQEWNYEQEIEVKYVVFRALLASFTSLKYVATPENLAHLSIPTLIDNLMKSKELPVNDIELEQYMGSELTIASLVKGFVGHTELELVEWYQLLKLNVQNTHLSLSIQIDEGNKQIDERDKQIGERDKQIEEFDRQIQQLISSSSWKITRPFRVIKKTIKEFLTK